VDGEIHMKENERKEWAELFWLSCMFILNFILLTFIAILASSQIYELGTGNEEFTGSIDAGGFYDYPLTQEEIRGLWNHMAVVGNISVDGENITKLTYISFWYKGRTYINGVEI